DVYALPGSSAAIRASLAAADASADRVFGDRLSWRTPAAGTDVKLDGGATLTLVPVDHLPPGGEAAACVVSADGVRVVYSGDTRHAEARRPTSPVRECRRSGWSRPIPNSPVRTRTDIRARAIPAMA